MSKTDKAGIYVDAYQLQRLLKRAQYTMTKTDRIIYGTPALRHNEEFLSSFAMAYNFPRKRDEYYEKMCACFEVLKVDLRIIAEENIIKCPDPENAGMKPDTMKIKIFELVARIDEGVDKWGRSIEKGKTGTARDAGSSD